MSTLKSDGKYAWAWGGTLLASVLLIVSGLWQVLEGIAAIQNDAILNPTPGYLYRFTDATWGWIHLVIGVVCVVIGAALFTDRPAFRPIAMVIVALSAVSNFLWLPRYPFWAICVMAVDVFVIWSLARYEPFEPDRASSVLSDGAGARGPAVRDPDAGPPIFDERG